MRECGILLPVASLPSRYGIGGFSKEAYEFVDKLKAAGQGYWQILPLGPTGYGDSPYQSFSAFAGNPYFIDLDELRREKLLTKKECKEAEYEDGGYIDYERIYKTRFPLLRKAYERFCLQVKERGEDLDRLLEESLFQETREYCFYAAVKRYFHEKSFEQWDEDIRFCRPEAMERYGELLRDEIRFYEFQQMMFERQWKALKNYANKKGIRLIGDIPIYVAYDSADSWRHPELFQFDEQRRPIKVAGCPPDAFAVEGQLWGNPLYRWEYHRQTDFAWWMRRMEYCFQMYDVVRVDHFRGFDEYYAVPYGAENAIGGTWEQGPGLSLFQKMQETFGKLPIIAEDLGFLTPSVHKLLEDTGFPGMKVLEFAFHAEERNEYLPMFYPKNCVVYTGTHDNDSILGWYKTLSREDRKFARDYLNNSASPKSEICWDFIRLALSSVAELAVIPLQDYLGLGSEARINTPSTLGDNWRWRMKKDAFTPAIIRRCRRMNQLYGRSTPE